MRIAAMLFLMCPSQPSTSHFWLGNRLGFMTAEGRFLSRYFGWRKYGTIPHMQDLHDELRWGHRPDGQRNRTVCKDIVHRMVGSNCLIHLPEEKRTFICTFDLSFCLRPPCCLGPPFFGTCLAEPSATSVIAELYGRTTIRACE
jgi:hypothetical protein